MLLFLEIALTVAAWKKGWGAKALLPFAAAFGLVVLMVSGGDASRGGLLMVDLLLIAALIKMTKQGPATAPAPDSGEAISA